MIRRLRDEYIPPEEDYGSSEGSSFIDDGSEESSEEEQSEESEESEEVKDGAIFEGKTFVLTGLLESISRVHLTKFIEKQGGRVTGSVSGKTTYLISGEKLEDGRDASTSCKY